jgi:hypothetical protein
MAAPCALSPPRAAAQKCLDAYDVLDSGSEAEFDDLAAVREKAALRVCAVRDERGRGCACARALR